MLKLRYYQQAAFEYFFRYVSENHGKHPVIVIPTGGGKSLLQAHIVKNMIKYDGTRVLLITHRKTLIEQNCNELIENLDNDLFIDIGIYSAGVKSRDTKNRVLFAGIHSVYKKAYELGFFDLIMVDECHRIPPKSEGMYRKFLDDMMKINPKIVIGGMSATPYRLKTGMLTDGPGALFDDICYECSIIELIDPTHFRNKDKTQYLCKMISKNGAEKIDLSNVHIRGGEFIPREMEKAFNKNNIIQNAVKEIIEYTHNRKKILVFTAGISHCEAVQSEFSSHGISTVMLHSKQSDDMNERNINLFRSGQVKYLLNVDILTEGFNDKNIDCIVMLRATMSPGLYSQIAGRGLRMSPGKENCLFLDYGGNILRHGPIDKIEIRMNRSTGKREVTQAPMKECPKCHSLMFLAARECYDCGYEFPESDRHNKEASTAEILSQWKKPVEYDIKYIKYGRHQKTGSPDSVRVDYYINDYYKISEWICIDHQGFARQKAKKWVQKRINGNDRDIFSVDKLLENCDALRTPEKIIVDENGKFQKIVGYMFLSKEQKEKKEQHEFDKQLESLIL